MPYKRKPIRSLMGIKKYVKKALPTRRPVRSVRPVRRFKRRGIHTFRRYSTVEDTKQVAAGYTELNDSKIFYLYDVGNYTEFTPLFDQYRIMGVTVSVQLITNPDSTNATNPNTVVTNNLNVYPKFWYINDADDSSPETLAQMRQRDKVRHFVLRPNKEFKIFVRPSILNQLYRTSLTTGYSPKWRQWIDCGNTDVPHYCLKYIIDTNGVNYVAAPSYQVRLTYRYHLQFKDTR